MRNPNKPFLRRMTTNKFEDMIRYVMGMVTLVICIWLAARIAQWVVNSTLGLAIAGGALVFLGAVALLKGSRYEC